MVTNYLGKLDYADPLYEVLRSHACPNVMDPRFHVNRMSSRRVYKYTEEKSGIATIGKFFDLNDKKEDRILRIEGEYSNLQLLRSYGFDARPNYVVRPITKYRRIGLALMEDFVHGKDLDHYLKKAIYHGGYVSLKDKLSRLASFLYILHRKTEGPDKVDLGPVSSYFQKVLTKLYKREIISDGDKQRFLKLMDKWLNNSIMQRTNSSIVHGDSTPTNFIFTDMGDVVAIDVERMKKTDRIYDVSMVCGELKHTFLWRTGNPSASEPFVRHFLKSYARHFVEYEKSFNHITQRNPFYMALTELRIARNRYLGQDYSKRLAFEALECLKWGLRLQ